MTVKLGICVFIIFYVTFVITIVIFRLVGNVCSHVGAMLYKIIAVNNLPCTSQENRWIATSNGNDLVCFIFQF